MFGVHARDGAEATCSSSSVIVYMTHSRSAVAINYRKTVGLFHVLSMWGRWPNIDNPADVRFLVFCSGIGVFCSDQT